MFSHFQFPHKKHPDYQLVPSKKEENNHIFVQIDDSLQSVSLISANIQSKLLSDLSKSKRKTAVDGTNKKNLKKLPSLKKLANEFQVDELDELNQIPDKGVWKLKHLEKFNHGLEEHAVINEFIKEDKLLGTDFNISLKHIESSY
jgi:hypothetical protein